MPCARDPINTTTQISSTGIVMALSKPGSLPLSIKLRDFVLPFPES